MSGEPALVDMYTPQAGTEKAREELAEAYAAGNLPPVTKCPTVIAKGARFLAGISRAKQTASVSAPSWQDPAMPLSPVLDEVAARGTLESIGIRVGFKGGYADRAGKKALLAAGRELASNNNGKKKIAA
jgi:hypothetical protein